MRRKKKERSEPHTHIISQYNNEIRFSSTHTAHDNKQQHQQETSLHSPVGVVCFPFADFLICAMTHQNSIFMEDKRGRVS